MRGAFDPELDFPPDGATLIREGNGERMVVEFVDADSMWHVREGHPLIVGRVSRAFSAEGIMTAKLWMNQEREKHGSPWYDCPAHGRIICATPAGAIAEARAHTDCKAPPLRPVARPKSRMTWRNA